MKKILLLILCTITFYSCATIPQSSRYDGNYGSGDEGSGAEERIYKEEPKIKVSKTVFVPADGSAPIAGYEESAKSDAVVTFSEIGQKYKITRGQTVNFIYDGIDPESTFIVYESTLDGYSIKLAYKTDQILVNFSKLCQVFIVASPTFTNVYVPENLRYEQIVWTPREDGSWEVRIGTVERGCQSRALQNLQKLRSGNYEKSVPK